MYIPPAFVQRDPAAIWELIESHSFALLASCGGERPIATHLPLLAERNAGERGRLLGHMAKANDHWRTLGGREVLCVFSGPHAYVSPSWYEAEQVVPTWNYVAVHAYGTCRIIDEKPQVAEILARYVDRYERGQESPWTLDTDTQFFARMADMVVAFAIDITRLEGKWKLSQNQPRERQEKVVRRLARQPDENSQAIAQWMRSFLEASEPSA